jgi:hypothetical protein
LKSTEIGKSIGNTGLLVGITGKPVPKPINHFFKKIKIFKNSDSLSGLLIRFSPVFNQFFNPWVRGTLVSSGFDRFFDPWVRGALVSFDFPPFFYLLTV